MALASASTARESMIPTTTTSESELCGTELTDESSSSTAVSLDSLIWQGKGPLIGILHVVLSG